MRYLIVILFFIFLSCQQGNVSQINQTDSLYLNHNDSVAYVGKEICKTCHQDIYNSFIETGMGQSFANATKSKSLLDENGNPLIYDKSKNLYYQPLWKKDSLYLLEFRLNQNDTTHKLLKKIDFIIGSGQHTNSHLYSINGYLHQAPYTLYTQNRKADLPPGFENNNSRFNREIGLECMSCHNAYPKHKENTINQYTDIPNGIDCERCHGPGEVHVKEKQNGVFVDISHEIDYSIVNPSKLSQNLQFDICSRCHLQGISVLKNNENWDDFVPGEELSKTMEIFLPKYENDNSFIMASHVERLQQSNCYNNGGITCISCHDPHQSVTTLSVNYFNNKCTDCHQVCEEKDDNINCVSCHMPKSSSLDIPHISITDHKISVHAKGKEEQGNFLGLVCMNNNNPSNLSKAKAYIKYYESFQENIIYLDSAQIFLEKCNLEESFALYIQYWYLRKNYKELLKLAESYNIDKIINKLIINDLSFTYFRIAEAYSKYDITEESYIYYLKAIEISPNNLDFLLKTSVLEIKMSKFELAKNRLKKIISLNPNFEKAYFNLGAIYMNVEKDYQKASEYFNTALQLNPDYEEARNNLIYIEIND